MKNRAGWALAITLVGWLLASSLRGQPAPSPAQSRPALDQPSRLTLHLHNVDLSTAINAVAEASGNYALRPQPSNPNLRSPLVTIDCDDEPFWSVMRGLCVQARGYVMAHNDSLTIWTSAPPSNDPSLTDGPVMFTEAAVEHNVDFTKPLDWCAVQMQVVWEPRLNPVAYWPVIVPDEALDENGLSLRPTLQTPLDNGEISGGGQWANAARPVRLTGIYRLQPCTVWVRLVTPDNAGHRISRLKGKLVLRVEKEEQSNEIGTVADLKAAGAGGKKVEFDSGLSLTVTLREIARLPGQVMDLQIVLGEIDQKQRLRQTQLDAVRAWTVDDSGKRTACKTMGRARVGAAEFFLPNNSVKVILESTVEQELMLPFEFKDLPLP